MTYKPVIKAREILLYQQSASDAPFAISVSATRKDNAVTFDAVLYADWVPNESNSIMIRDGTFCIVRPPNRPPIITCSLDWVVSRICQAYGYPFAPKDGIYITDEMACLYRDLMNVK